MRTSLRDEASFGEGLVMGDQGKALAEGLYWMAEKLMWGYEDTDINPVEAFRVYKRAADLGFSDALIRVGELQEHGKGPNRAPQRPSPATSEPPRRETSWHTPTSQSS